MLSEPGASTSNVDQSQNDDVDVKAVKLLGEGKRHLLVGDAPTAVTAFQEACEILADKYGELSDQCGDSYYNYGNALLELGRMESGVLGNALDGVPEGAATDTDEENDDKNIENANKLKDVCTGTTDMDEGESEDDETGNETGEENKEENPDDVPNFQLAWEMLELSRVIYSRKAKENILKVAQVHFKLGELGLETEQYAQSLEDFSKCLDIQKDNLEPQSRMIAGSHYNLGLAYTLDNNYDKAMDHFKEAKKTIQERIVKLDQDVADEDKEKEEDYEEKVKRMKQEVTELKELVPDILAKIEDAKESKAQLPAGETTSGFDAPGTTSAAPVQAVQVKRKSDTGAVADITHLVKRKRTEETNSTDADKTKRIKHDGSGDACPVNGTDAPKSETKEDTAMECIAEPVE